jgi:Lysozyme like domain
VKFNAKQKVLIIGLVILLPFLTGTVSQANSTIDGETATIEMPAILGIDQYSGATELTALELKDLLSLVGFKGYSLKLAWSIVMRESRGHPLSHNTSKYSGDNSYGLFQINMLGSLGADRREKFGIKDNKELLDPIVNAKAAFYMSAHGTNFGSWGLGPDAYDGTPSEPAVTVWLDKCPN